MLLPMMCENKVNSYFVHYILTCLLKTCYFYIDPARAVLQILGFDNFSRAIVCMNIRITYVSTPAVEFKISLYKFHRQGTL
jgi:hypothetical protein